MISLIDTCIIVDYLRGNPRAVGVIKGEFVARRIPCISVISYMEIYAGAKPEEEDAISKIFGNMRVLGIGTEIVGYAGRYLNIYGKSHGMELADALIAATAFILDVKLVTLNRRHFPMTDIQVYLPY